MPDCTGSEKRAAPLVDVERQPVLALEDVPRVTPTASGELRMDAQALEVSVERHHVARLDEVEHQLDLLRIAVTGGVHRRVARGDHVAADVVERSIVSFTARSLPGIGVAEKTTVSPSFSCTCGWSR